MPADIGTQTVTLKFFDPANTGLQNLRFKDIRETGIYKGGYLTVTDATHALLTTFVAEVGDGVYQVRVETTVAVSITTALATPYIVLRWLYTGSSTIDFAEMIVVATPAANDVVIAKCNFSGSTLIGFDYADATYPRTTPDTHHLHLNVEETVDTELRVRIRAGVVQGFSGATTVADQKSDLIVAPTVNPKIFLVYIDMDTGALAIDSSGLEATTPVAPDYAGKVVLAEITLAVAATNIVAADIKDVRAFLYTPVAADDVTIQINGDGKLERINAGTPYPGVGTRTTLDSLGAVLANNEVYQASGDGFVSASQDQGNIDLRVDGSNPPTTVVSKDADNDNTWANVSGLVQTGEYVKVVANTAVTVYNWTPLGTGALVKQ